MSYPRHEYSAAFCVTSWAMKIDKGSSPDNEALVGAMITGSVMTNATLSGLAAQARIRPARSP